MSGLWTYYAKRLLGKAIQVRIMWMGKRDIGEAQSGWEGLGHVCDQMEQSAQRRHDILSKKEE